MTRSPLQIGTETWTTVPTSLLLGKGTAKGTSQIRFTAEPKVTSTPHGNRNGQRDLLLIYAPLMMRLCVFRAYLKGDPVRRYQVFSLGSKPRLSDSQEIMKVAVWDKPDPANSYFVKKFNEVKTKPALPSIPERCYLNRVPALSFGLQR